MELRERSPRNVLNALDVPDRVPDSRFPGGCLIKPPVGKHVSNLSELDPQPVRRPTAWTSLLSGLMTA